jgi:hypothetical protein
MPRNSSGIYSLPNSPVVPDTIIESADENTTRNDIESELTNSLDRNGRGGMLAPFRVVDGTITVPGLSWIAEPTSGWYRKNANDFWFAIAGQDRFGVTPTTFTFGQSAAISFQSPILHADGTVAAPGISWANEPTAGWFRVTGVRSYALGGTRVESLGVDASSTSLLLNAPIVGGVATFSLIGSPSSATTYRQLFLRQSATEYRLGETLAGGATSLQMKLDFPAGISIVNGGLTSTTAAIFAGQVEALYQVSKANSGFSWPVANQGLFLANGFSVVGGDANTYAPWVINTQVVNGNPVPTLSFTPTGTSGGIYKFLDIKFDSQFLVMAATDGTGPGVELAVWSPSGRQLSRIITDALDFAPGQDKAKMRFGVARNNFAGNNDFVMGYNSIYQPQFVINGGFSGQIANMGDAPLAIVATGSNRPGIIFNQSGVISWEITLLGDSNMYVGSTNGSGPTAIFSFSMRISTGGDIAARSFNPVTFAATNITPVTGALSDVLKLRGVRCFNTETQRPDIRLEVDEVELAFPELVSELRSEDEATVTGRAINYMALAAPIIEAIRELHNRVTILEAAP